MRRIRCNGGACIWLTAELACPPASWLIFSTANLARTQRPLPCSLSVACAAIFSAAACKSISSTASFAKQGFEEYGNRGEAATFHADIAAYFERRPSWVGRGFLPLQPGRPDSRKADELPWQLSQAQEPAKLARVLGDIGFLEAKISSGQSLDLLDDFRRLESSCAANARIC